MVEVLVNPWVMIPAVLVAVIGTARLTRVIVHDDFPPAVWLRIKWSTITHDGPWAKLLHCGWCLSPWITLFAVAWFLVGAAWVAWLFYAWWVFWGWLALSYLSGQYFYFDEGKPNAS